MSRWFRVYDDLIDDPKVQRLPDRLFKALINLWCLTSKNGGHLPAIEEIAFKLRLSEAKATSLVGELKAAGLIDEVDGQSCPHNWNGRQYKSDGSTPRVKRHRERQRNVSCNVSSGVSETPPDTETESDTEKIPERTADAVSSKYVFETGIIRLNQRDFEKWKDAFSALDLKAELISLTKWAETQQNWFHAVAGALAKRNRQVIAQQKTGVQKLPLTPSGNPWPEGIL